MEDTVEMFNESGYDLSRVWVYRNAASRQEKETVLQNLAQVERSASGDDTYLNASFALQGIRQVFKKYLGADDDTGMINLSNWYHICLY